MTAILKRPLARAIKVALSHLSIENKLSILTHLAPECGVKTLGVAGEYGLISSAVNDRFILRPYALTKTWAKRTNDLLLSFFQDKGGHYIDVGANIGLTTIPAAQNARVSCLAIEPEPTNFANLSVNIMRNCHHGNVELRQLAIFTHSTTLQLEIAAENLGDHRLRLNESLGMEREHERPIISVQALPLDEVAVDRRGHLAVKIDTQGAEPFVVASGNETLSRAGLIIMEFSPYYMARMGANVGDLITFLRNQFSTLRIAMNEGEEVSPPLPANDICNQLAALAVQHANNPAIYADIIAQKA